MNYYWLDITTKSFKKKQGEKSNIQYTRCIFTSIYVCQQLEGNKIFQFPVSLIPDAPKLYT